jgi:hypothetical protein
MWSVVYPSVVKRITAETKISKPMATHCSICRAASLFYWQVGLRALSPGPADSVISTAVNLP